VKIADSARHLLNLIDDILDFAKIEARQFSIETAPLRIAALVDHVYSMTAERAQAKGLQFECTVDRDLRDLVLLGDFVRMGQVLLNFVGNAIKFTAQGRIGLSARRVREERGGVVVRFEVADTGIGIDAEALPRIFEPFEQVEASTTRKFGGAGLGLPISRQLALLMGGEVGVESRAGAGSTFWFELALAPGSALAPGASRTPIPALHTEARVLLVEDNEVNRELAEQLLHRAGLAVDVAHDGEEAESMVAAGDYDLVLMDLQMPRLGGVEASRRIRAQPRPRHLAIVALTANAGPEDRLACADAGVDDFIAKPVDPATLYAVLARWIPARPVGAPAADGAVLDVDSGLRHVGGKPALYRRLLERFAEIHLDDASRLRLALSKGDIDGARLIVHALKAAAATIGAEPVHATAALVERTLAVEGLATDDGVRELSARLAVLGGVIATVARPEETVSSDGPGQAASTQLPESLRLLMSLLADDDFRACEVWRSVAGPLRGVLAPAVADELDLLFERFDFPAALARLRTLPALADV
jgi:CheY-like chemotaxis protein/HPt (histidine-containing phosphotransfer) domain-containing protein